MEIQTISITTHKGYFLIQWCSRKQDDAHFASFGSSEMGCVRVMVVLAVMIYNVM